ncbi:MAG: hypothetical protein QXI19_10755, partial [Candidatus Caldarchaeum sp.]
MVSILAVGILLGFLVMGFVFFTRRIWFYRDPEHGEVPQDPYQILSPVYGIVSYVKQVRDGVAVCEKRGERFVLQELVHENMPRGWLIGIAM